MMNNSKIAIPQDSAIQLCAEIRQKFAGKWWTLAGMQCMGCSAATKGELTQRCFYQPPDFRGCNLVNARFDRRNA